MTARRVTVVLVVVVAVYLLLLGHRGFLLVSDGRPVSVILGLGVLLLPLVGGFLVVREVQFGLGTQALARRLAAAGDDVVDDLPRRPSGRADRAAADALFARRRDEVEQAPDDWRAWFRLSAAYEEAGDRRRARSAMRQALALEAAQRAAQRRPDPR